jgi:hypothetical protein
MRTLYNNYQEGRTLGVAENSDSSNLDLEMRRDFRKNIAVRGELQLPRARACLLSENSRGVVAALPMILVHPRQLQAVVARRGAF